MKFIQFLAALILITLNSELAWTHGENKPGPHGGFIRMPGAFHTEVIPTGSNSLKVFLLDINWKNPSVKGSSLKVTHQESKTTQACKIESNYYLCEFPKNIDLTKQGNLNVEAKREDQTGAIVSYELPLKLQKADDGHSGHH